MHRGVKFAGLIAGVIVVGALVLLSSRRPHWAIVGIVAWVPLQLPVLAYLFKLGAPATAVRYMGYLKEFWAVSLLLAVLAGPEKVRSHRRFDVLDWIALGFIGLSLAYLLIPFVAPGSLGGQSFQVRLNAWRAEALFVVVFFLARQLVYPEVWVRRVRSTLFVVASVLAGFAVWERLATSAYRHFITVTLDYPGFSTSVLKGSASAGLFGLTQVGNSSVLRVGSLLNSPLTLGFFMIIPFGLGLERLAARRLSGLALIAAVGSMTAIALTLTRSALLAAGVASILAVGFANRRSPGRLRLLIGVLTAAVVLIPAAGHSSIKHRFEGVFNGAQTDDTQQHISASRDAANFIVSHPAGGGLGTNTGTALRFNTGISVTAEDSYLETGAELGLAAMVLLIACVLTLLVQLRGRSKVGGTQSELAAGAWLAGCGLAVGGCFLQTWLEIPTALVFWAIAGMTLGGVSDIGSLVPVARRANRRLR